MKILSIVKATNYLAKLPGDTSVSVWFHAAFGDFYIFEGDEAISNVPELSVLICRGQPDQFFEALKSIIYNWAINDTDAVWK